MITLSLKQNLKFNATMTVQKNNYTKKVTEFIQSEDTVLFKEVSSKVPIKN